MMISILIMIICRYKLVNRDLIHFCHFLRHLLSAEALEASPKIRESCTSRGAADETSRGPEWQVRSRCRELKKTAAAQQLLHCSSNCCCCWWKRLDLERRWWLERQGLQIECFSSCGLTGGLNGESAVAVQRRWLFYRRTFWLESKSKIQQLPLKLEWEREKFSTFLSWSSTGDRMTRRWRRLARNWESRLKTIGRWAREGSSICCSSDRVPK